MGNDSGKVKLPSWVIKKMVFAVINDMKQLEKQVADLDSEPIGDEDLSPRIHRIERMMTFNRFTDFLMEQDDLPEHATSAKEYNEGLATKINIIMFADYLTRTMGYLVDTDKKGV